MMKPSGAIGNPVWRLLRIFSGLQIGRSRPVTLLGASSGTGCGRSPARNLGVAVELVL
jgi:hypothetical protein